MRASRACARGCMALWDDLALGLAIFSGVSGGIWVGARLALGSAGEFVEDTLLATENTALRLLNDPKVTKLVQVADKVAPMLGKGAGGTMDKLASFAGRLFGLS